MPIKKDSTEEQLKEYLEQEGMTHDDVINQEIEEEHKKMFEKYLGENVESIKKWQCSKCGYVHNEASAPKRCPVCEQYRVGGIN